MSKKTAKPKEIHAFIGVNKVTDAALAPILQASLKGLMANTGIYSKLPVDLTTYGNGITAYIGSIPAAVDGSKTATAQKDKLRNEAIKMYKLLAHYVETNCNDDMATFLLSGFQPASTTKTPPQPLPKPVIKSVVQGPNSGQLKVTIGVVTKALSYFLRRAPQPAAGAQPAWIEDTVTTKKPVIYSELTPGTIYIFQVKALGRAGYTDYSDPVSKMVT